ncbi:hypothetical protein DBR43_29505 [Pedobacter sp. KBW06]|uniref:hypothetical protein n=1 Tax=Pedobacter sp. KBW06 TaxID=2153359 RepID=UPI000F5A58DA|nr:hypothetical protein [Pedobacter sp. KBW06]RQO66360.1 hypothetical protein DBR43_29505 [Pedobacter sp. KBW06]
MSIESSGSREPQNGNCNDAEAETATQKTIHLLKEDYCKRLKGKVAELGESELTYDGTVMIYQKKKCAFVKTEKNYLLVRNLELKVGVELITASDEIKKNVAADILQNDALVLALKAVVKTAKDAKAKFGELREAAGKLDGCRKDSCSAVQMKILGCSEGDDCNDNNKQEESSRRPDPCRNVCQILDDLITIPDSLSQDIDIIFNSAAEIVGIQSFSNIKSLEKFQQDFATNAKAFDDLIQAQMTSGGLSLKKAQEDFVLSTKTATQSGYALYNKRNEVGTLDETKDYLCHHECKCIAGCGCDGEKGEDDNRLKKCKCDICDICKEVTEVYSCENPSDNSSCD